MTDTTSDAPLDRALDDLVLAAEARGGLDAGVLEDVVARHPDHADALTDFAVEWHVQELAPGLDPVCGADEPAAGLEEPVTRAVDRFRAALDAVEGPADPFAGRSADELRRLAAELDLDLSLVAKLRHRRLDADSVPEQLRRDLARALDVDPAVVADHLAAPPAVHGGAWFKARARPAPPARESFRRAVERSHLDADAKSRWLEPGSGRS